MVLVDQLDLDLRVVHAFQLPLEVQVVHHVLPYQVDQGVVVVEEVEGEGVAAVVAAVSNNTHLNMMVHMKLDIHNHMGWLLSCNLPILK